ncbi:MAG TPA: alkaline phosphatase PafA [Chitinophagales bacterium]|nr:alkaline phosphatase PafA [Chitinophagales bacterium]
MNRRKTQEARRKIAFSLMVFVAFACAFHQGVAQQKSTGVKATASELQMPKLVVGIVVDQMRYDLLYRYYSRYGDGGFKRLLNDGFSCEQTHYNYMPTYTGPGHTSIYTGSTPSNHGIIANNWYDKKSGTMVYCAQDDSVSGVGTASKAGRMSPKRMIGTTVTDQLQLATVQRSKVIGIALKDRGAIMPAGHSADAAYWLDDAAPNWISSSFYMTDLPQWVKDFNALEKVKQYTSKPWETLYPIETYTASIADNNPYEVTQNGESTPTFPHDLPGIVSRSGSYSIVRTTPFGNDLTTDFAIAALKGEAMGRDAITDFLCLSYSSTDYVGHAYGPMSVETEDTYLRLDRDIERLLKHLDETVGLSNVLIFLTADHGVSDVPAYLKTLRIQSTVVDENAMLRNVKSYCKQTFGDSLVARFYNQQFSFNETAVARLKTTRSDAAEKVAGFVRTLDETFQVYTANDLTRYEYNHLHQRAIQLGFHPVRSGDVMVNFPPHYIDFGDPGTTHGSPYTYDTHVPLLWFGWNVKKGKTYERVDITDIAVTLSAMLHILPSSVATGNVITPLLD